MKYDELISELRSEICKNNCVDCVYMMTGCTPKLCEQAADAIEELQKPKWIPVSERLPETDKCVLVISYGRVCYARLLKSGNNGSHPEFILQDGLSDMLRQPVIETTAHNEFTENRITHWQYLPEPPKEETDG